jgi:hypothetical protein
VFSICKRYFDEELDSADNLLFETTLTGFKYGKVLKKELNKIDTQNLGGKFGDRENSRQQWFCKIRATRISP